MNFFADRYLSFIQIKKRKYDYLQLTVGMYGMWIKGQASVCVQANLVSVLM